MICLRHVMEQEEQVGVWLYGFQTRLTGWGCPTKYMSVLFENDFFVFLEIKKVLVILTDGRSNTGQVSGPARQLRNSGVVIFSVGIGHTFSMQELRVMASDPVDQHVVALRNFTELEYLAEELASQTCNGKCGGYWTAVVRWLLMNQ